MAKMVGIVYEATNKQDYDRIKAFTQYLKQRNVRILSIGYIKTPDIARQFKTLLEYRFFAKKDLNWHFKPICLEVRNFISTDLDILIDLSLSDCLPTKYVSGGSIARFKVGLTGADGVQLFDMTIDVGNKRTLDHVIGNVKYYLDMINKEQENKISNPYA